jgi:hypothetical protein
MTDMPALPHKAFRRHYAVLFSRAKCRLFCKGLPQATLHCTNSDVVLALFDTQYCPHATYKKYVFFSTVSFYTAYALAPPQYRGRPSYIVLHHQHGFVMFYVLFV